MVENEPGGRWSRTSMTDENSDHAVALNRKLLDCWRKCIAYQEDYVESNSFSFRE
jgi:hypothetical protein